VAKGRIAAAFGLRISRLQSTLDRLLGEDRGRKRKSGRTVGRDFLFLATGAAGAVAVGAAVWPLIR